MHRTDKYSQQLNHLASTDKHSQQLKHLASTDKYSQQLNHLASLAKWLSVRLWTKWLWVWISLLSLKLQIWCLFRARSPLTFRHTIECRFTLKLVRDMIITYSQMYGTDKYSQQLNHLASLAKWLSVRLRTKWLWVRIPLLS